MRPTIRVTSGTHKIAYRAPSSFSRPILRENLLISEMRDWAYIALIINSFRAGDERRRLFFFLRASYAGAIFPK